MKIKDFKSQITRTDLNEADISALFKYGQQQQFHHDEWEFFVTEINDGEWGINTEIDDADDSDMEIVVVPPDRILVRIV